MLAYALGTSMVCTKFVMSKFCFWSHVASEFAEQTTTMLNGKVWYPVTVLWSTAPTRSIRQSLTQLGCSLKATFLVYSLLLEANQRDSRIRDWLATQDKRHVHRNSLNRQPPCWMARFVPRDFTRSKAPIPGQSVRVRWLGCLLKANLS